MRNLSLCVLFRAVVLLLLLLPSSTSNDNNNIIQEAKDDDNLISAWRFWWMQRLQELDHHQKHLERVLVEVALSVIRQNHRQQRLDVLEEWLVSYKDTDEWNKCRRMARACRPVRKEQPQHDPTFSVAVEVRSTGEVSEFRPPLSSNNEMSSSDLFVGMMLQVYYGRDCSKTKKQEASLHHKQEWNDDASLPACIDALQLEQYNEMSNAIDVTYELLEPIHRELGIVPKHAFDYAYRPANLVYPLPAAESSTNVHHKTHLVFENGIDGIMSVVPGKTTATTSWWQWFSKPDFSFKWYKRDTSNGGQYEKMGDRAFAGGSHGEVWRARRRGTCNNHERTNQNHDSNKKKSAKQHKHECSDDQRKLIMKRLKVEHGFPLLEAGLREVYFGSLLGQEIKGKSHFTAYVDHFFREAKSPPAFSRGTSSEKDTLEMWIVFEDAGPSLRSYLYTPVASGDFLVYQHSSFWTKLRMSVYNRSVTTDEEAASVAIRMEPHMGPTSGSQEDYESGASANGEQQQRQKYNSTKRETTAEGRAIMREILMQILASAAFLHEHGIVHRDIKPSNVMCKNANDANMKHVGSSRLECVLGDFSSAWDHFSSQNLYANGPSAEEQTDEYAPPEVLFGGTWVPFNEEKPQSYDSWSIGVLALELLLGTPNVFSVDQRTTALLTNKLTKEGASAEEIQRALYLAALSQFCIYMPTAATDKLSWPLRAGDPLHKAAMVKQSCTIQDFHHALRTRDPLGLGFDSSSDTLLRLIWGLLAWDPLERLTASEALLHPYFTKVDNSKVTTSDLIPGKYIAIESQTLDPRMDFHRSEAIHEFICPKCKRKFTDWQSCNKHANSRRHAKFCTYDRSTLPTCLNAHSMLPAHPMSGYCDIQGRRHVMEDFHAVQLNPTHQYYGMFDGHTGNLASKYVTSTCYEEISETLSDIDTRVKTDANWKSQVKDEMGQAFADIHDRFLMAVAASPLDLMDQSGTTATILFVTKQAVIVASIGDSRAVLASTPNDGEVVPIQLTLDHVASNRDEKRMVEERGGFVSSSGGIDRVNGTLAVTRSIGDANLAPVLSRVPHVVAMERSELKELCGPKSNRVPCFIVLASDGLWDVMSNQEAVDMVSEVVTTFSHGISWEEGGAFQEAAQILTQEAYVRGSTDNIGVCVVAIE